MTKLKKRALMFSKTQPDYVKDGLVLYLDAEESLMLMNIDSETARVWNDRAISGQRARVDAVTQTEKALLFDGVNSRGIIDLTEYISLLGVLTGIQERTIEIVCKLNDTEATQTVFLGKGAATDENGAAGLWYRPASGGFKAGTFTNQAPSIVSNVTERASYSTVYGTENINDYILYHNGVECPKGEVAGNMNNYTYLTIGSRYYNDTYSYRLKGEINCIRVYDRKLSDEERAHNLEIDKRRFDLNVG